MGSPEVTQDAVSLGQQEQRLGVCSVRYLMGALVQGGGDTGAVLPCRLLAELNQFLLDLGFSTWR